MPKWKLVHYAPFLVGVKQLVMNLRLLTVAPVVIEKNKEGDLIANVSRAAEKMSFISCIGIGILMVYNFRFLTESLQAQFIVLLFYFGRTTLAVLLHITCLVKRELMAHCLNEVSKLGVALSKIWALITTASLVMLFVLSLAFTFRLLPSSALISILITISSFFPFSAFMNVTVLFVTQVSAIRSAFEELKQNTLLKESLLTNSAELPSLRPLMKQHQRLRGVCFLLGATYGPLIFLATSGLCVEITFRIVATIFNPMDIILFTYELALAVISATTVVGVLLVCQDAENEVREIKAHVSGILDTTTRNHRSFENLEWRVQVKHLQISFDANSFFDLNGMQLTVILSTVITYSLIITQNWALPTKRN